MNKLFLSLTIFTLALAGILAPAPSHADQRLVTPEFWKQTNAEEIENMIQNGASIHIVEPEFLWTPLHLASGFTTDSRIIIALLNQGADIHATDRDGAHPLHIAAGFNIGDGVVKLLLNRGADIEFQDNNGFTPLHWAAANASSPVSATLLLKRNADIEARSNEELTPILAAAEFSTSEALLRLLFDSGADITAIANDGISIVDRLERNDALRDTPTRELIEQKYCEQLGLSC
ncbi:MAG: ankyrin repeat domain-containing protein [Hyphomicrobiales bacterium]|nr:ankyrin repeat domain-containing protein [Hyphomicrobiales bacterium]